MAKFQVRFKQVLYASEIIEAENEEEAFEIADERNNGDDLPDECFMFYSQEIENIAKITE